MVIIDLSPPDLPAGDIGAADSQQRAPGMMHGSSAAVRLRVAVSTFGLMTEATTMKRHLALTAALLTAFACAKAPAPPAEPAQPAAPARVEATVPASDGVEIAYTVEGSGEPTLVFIHGWECDSTYWAGQVPVFAADHRVIAIDLPGHGKSGDNRQEWTFTAYADDVKTVVDHVGADPVVLIGHSMGAPVALGAAALMPGKVKAVVAVDSLQNADMKWDPKQFAGLIAAYEQDFPGTCNTFVRTMFTPASDPALMDRVAGDMCSGNAEMGIALLKQFPDYDMKAALAAAGVPVRCINSTVYPTNIEGNRRYAPDFDAMTMEGVGHFLMMEKPDEFNEKLKQTLSALG